MGLETLLIDLELYVTCKVSGRDLTYADFTM